MTIACMNKTSSNRSLKTFLMREAEEVLGPRSSWLTSQQHLQLTGMVFPLSTCLGRSISNSETHLESWVWFWAPQQHGMNGHTGDGPKKGHGDSEGPEASDILREAKRAEPVQQGEEKPQRDLTALCINTSWEALRMMVFFSGAQGQDRQRAQTEIWEILLKCKKKRGVLL